MAFFAPVPILSAVIAIIFMVCMLGLLFKIWNSFFAMILKKISDLSSVVNRKNKR